MPWFIVVLLGVVVLGYLVALARACSDSGFRSE